MIKICLGILIRIISNSYLNVFQKTLTAKGQKSSAVNFFTYLGLSALSVFFVSKIEAITPELLLNVLIMGALGALGNYFIIKALSIGELSALAPVNSFKPVVALLIGIVFLKETPSVCAVLAIFMIIAGTFIITKAKGNTPKKAIIYRILALLFSASEAVFIKKIILLTGAEEAFALWCFAGLIFSSLFMVKSKPKICSYKYQLYLILAVGIMQYSTNYVFSKMNVSYALALFQLSTLLSVFLGVKLFGEKELKKKVCASLIMIAGAVILILNI